jgi:cytochrome c oxidase subunit 4
MTDASHGHDAPAGNAKYLLVFIALCVLTGASFFTYSSLWPFPDQPQIGRTFMMAVSCVKASLVILFFMHLKYESGAWKYVLTIPAAMMSVFLILALVPDVMLRDRRYSEERIERMAVPAAAHAHAEDDAPTEDDAQTEDADHTEADAHADDAAH